MEQQSISNYAPYASSKSVLDVISRFRDRGLPDPLTEEGLVQIGIPSTMTNPTMRALRFLRFVDEGGNRFESFDRLRRASNDEYPQLLAEILRAAYMEVFQIVDPAQDSFEQISDAFRRYDPANQRAKMVRLFLGLSEEAGLAPPQPQRRRTPNIPESIRRQQHQQSQPPATPPAPPPLPRTKYDLIDAIVGQLPIDAKWDKGKRDRWLSAMESAVDLLISVEVEDDNPAA